MKIYNNTHIPEGLGNNQPTYEEMYQAGYESGYTDGYADGEDDCGKDFFTVEVLTGTSMQIPVEVTGWRKNEGIWQENEASGTTIEVQRGDKIQLLGEAKPSWLTMPTRYKVYGSPLSLFFGRDFVGKKLGKGGLSSLFEKQSGLVDASGLDLNVFGGPDSIGLPIPDEGLKYMFMDCRSLEKAPSFPNIRLLLGVESCFGMFTRCWSLTSFTFPDNEHNDTDNASCMYMFNGCSDLQSVHGWIPCGSGLRANDQMFLGCWNLRDISDTGGLAGEEEGLFFMFAGCDSLDLPEGFYISAHGESCCAGMFDGCFSLRHAPNISESRLYPYCFSDMFRSCTSLETPPELPQTELEDSCYYGMFRNCTSLTAAPALPATTLANGCYTVMFEECSNLTTAPVLPATTLAEKCYYCMFLDCTSLTTVPELPATTLEKHSYVGMLYGCSSLNYVKCLATDISAEDSTYYWLSGVSSTGTFVKAEGMNDWPTGESGIPEGWTVVDYVVD